MSKRFFDTDLWVNKPWFIELTPGEKAAWYYLLSTCDNVGVCNPVRKIADASIGEAIDWDSLPTKTNGNIVVIDGGKWWLQDFCTFQHPDIQEDSKSNAIQSYIKLLKQHGLFEQYMNSSCTVHELTKEKEEVKDKVREKVKEKEKNVRTREEKDLMARIKKTFLDVDPAWEDFARETKACYQLIAKARARGDPEEVLPLAIGMFHKKTTDPSEKDFWREQPMRPSVLNSTAIWSRVCKMIENKVADYSGPKLKF